MTPRWQRRACPAADCAIDVVVVRPRVDIGVWEVAREACDQPWQVAGDAPLCVLCGAGLEEVAGAERRAPAEALAVGA